MKRSTVEVVAKAGAHGAPPPSLGDLLEVAARRARALGLRDARVTGHGDVREVGFSRSVVVTISTTTPCDPGMRLA